MPAPLRSSGAHEDRLTAAEAIGRYHAACLRGDVRAGRDRLREAVDGRPDPPRRLVAFLRRVERRFFADPPALRFRERDPWVRAVLAAYARYHIAVLARGADPDTAGSALAEALAPLAPGPGGDAIDDVEARLARRFRALGWHYLGGVTHPFRGPYLYERRTTRRFAVDLPLGPRPLRVCFMHGFHARSWLDFATFGRLGAGGWAKPDGLYCVAAQYDLRSEAFRVNYLKHEAQHADDYVRFPALREGCQAILEYRAKLAELVYAESPGAWRHFRGEASDDPRFPHALASHRLVRDLSPALRESPGGVAAAGPDALARLRSAALDRYLAHTRELRDGLIEGD